MTVQELMSVVKMYEDKTRYKKTLIALTPEEWVSLQTDLIKEGIEITPPDQSEIEFFGEGFVQGKVNGINILLMEDTQPLVDRVEEDLEYIEAMRASADALIEEEE